ncbi:MAG: hypothetical protein R3B70_29025 [Polyangiaceae bacterium]
MSLFSWLPPLLEVDWNDYAATIERAYSIFEQDFGQEETRPHFLGRVLRLKRHPLYLGKSATFWHFVTQGSDEANREPVRERLERIAWPRALIVNAHDGDRVCRWAAVRKGETRWHLTLPDFSYLVVLADRGSFLLPWTAYPVEHQHQRRKLEAAWASASRGRPKS